MLNVKNQEVVVYNPKIPFKINMVTTDSVIDEYGKIKNILEHWHSEVEVTYTFSGLARHYIDGKCYQAQEGKVFITNSESIHKINSSLDGVKKDDKVLAITVQIKYEFLKKLIPDMKEKYFLAEIKDDDGSIRRIMEQFIPYSTEYAYGEYEDIKLTGFLYELIYILCSKALVGKDEVFPINSQKNMERLRGVIQYVEAHYMEPIVQADVAKKFYFTKEYFSRFFKKNTGVTFKEYLTGYRIQKAYSEVVNTDKKMMDIAFDNGFADERSYIKAFKEYYHNTPFQYRQCKKCKFIG